MPCALLIAAPGQGAEAARALNLVSALAHEPLDPAAAIPRLAQTQCLLDLLAVEAAAMDPATLDALLPVIATVASERRGRVVVALTPDQIDPVAAALVGTPATLLCDPSFSERVAAFAVQPPPAGPLHDNDRRPDATEIARLSAQVERIARTLAQLTGEDAADAAAGRDKRLPAFAPPAGDAKVEPAIVRAAIRARRLREQFFDRDMLGEPGWDILLDLFAAELEQLRVSVSSLCIAAAVPPTTGLRWITGMTEAGMLERHADPRDRRRAFITLAGNASVAMRNYFAAMQRQGLPLG